MRASDVAQHRYDRLDVDVQTRVIEEVRVEIARLHHTDGAIYDFGLVDADVEGDAAADPDKPQGCADRDDNRQRHDGRAHIGGLAPLSFCHCQSRLDPVIGMLNVEC
jgi:hypothetical protein